MVASSTIDESNKLASRNSGRRTNPLRSNLSAEAMCAAAPTAPSDERAVTRQSAQLPAFAPLLEELEIAGWSSHRRLLSGNFHDWLLLEGRRLMVIVGQAVGTESLDPVEAALAAQGAWAAVRAHAHHVSDAGALLSLVGRSLWSLPSGGTQINLAVAIVDTAEGNASLAVAGDCLAWTIRAAATEALAVRQPSLGAAADFAYQSHLVQLSLRERLLLVADDPQQRSAKLASQIAASFSQLDAESHRRMIATDAVALARQSFDEIADGTCSPASIVAVRRR